MDTRVLIVLPHPDDEAFGLAGTTAKFIKEGAQVTYACLTLGEMGRNMGFPPFANRVTLPSIRKTELEKSCRAIGIRDVRLLGFHDKMLEFEDPVKLDGSIKALVDELDPSVILTFYPGFSVHPDHDACGAAVIRVVEKRSPEKRPRVLCMAFDQKINQTVGNFDVTYDVRSFLKQKIASIQAHSSQFQAAELMGTNKLSEREIEERYGTERFWTYRFETKSKS